MACSLEFALLSKHIYISQWLVFYDIVIQNIYKWDLIMTIFQTMADILRYIQTENLYVGPSEVHWPHIVSKKQISQLYVRYYM